MKKSQNVGTKSAFTPKIFCNLLTVGSHKQNQLFISCKKIYYILFHSFLSLIVTLNLFFFSFFRFSSLIHSLSLPLSLLSLKQFGARVVDVWLQRWRLSTCGGGIVCLGFGAFIRFYGFLLGFGVVAVAVWKREIDGGRVQVCDLGLGLAG